MAGADDTSSKHAHVFCLTLAEVVLCSVGVGVAVPFCIVYELLFGTGGGASLFSTAVDAVQGSLFWSAVLVGGGRAVRGAHRWWLHMRGADLNS